MRGTLARWVFLLPLAAIIGSAPVSAKRDAEILCTDACPVVVHDATFSRNGPVLLSFAVTNGENFTVKDAEIDCNIYAPSGTLLAISWVVAYDLFPPHANQKVGRLRPNIFDAVTLSPAAFPEQGRSFECHVFEYYRQD